jgi:hypothetical protein
MSLDNKSTSNLSNKVIKQATRSRTSKAISLNKLEDSRDSNSNYQGIKKLVKGLRIPVIKNKKPK